MRIVRTASVTGALGLGLAALVAFAQGSPADASSESKIANAAGAAPAAVSAAATIVDWPEKEGAESKILRAGDNGWTCMPDDPSTPGSDPICVDEQSMKWFEGWLTHTEPKLTSPGLSYMLQGGATASSTDPFATTPAAGEDWMTDGPHVMVLPAQKLDVSAYAKDHHSGLPYVMWAGTPYEHLMIPVSPKS